VVLGRRLAQSLEASPGDELVVLSQAADGSLANDLFVVRGILLGVADATDRTAVIMTSQAFRELLVFPNGAHQIIVRRSEEGELDDVVAQIQVVAPDLTVRSWRQLMPTVAAMLDSTQDIILVVFFIVYVAVGILILNAMLMAVFERIRELGILKALGMGPGSILSLILLETTIQLSVALLAGLLLALPGMFVLARHGIPVGKLAGMSMMGLAMRPVWYGAYSASTIAGPVIMLVLMALVAALYPAAKAAWIRPVAAIQHR
jgi:ABC-type lipoprotein release transport system permease subunit